MHLLTKSQPCPPGIPVGANQPIPDVGEFFISPTLVPSRAISEPICHDFAAHSYSCTLFNLPALRLVLDILLILPKFLQFAALWRPGLPRFNSVEGVMMSCFRPNYLVSMAIGRSSEW